MKELRFSEYCATCRRRLAQLEKIFFVEKEIGRCFCSHECIREYFQPTIDAMEEEHERLRTKEDYSNEQCKKYAHYQALTLGEPDEIWINKTDSGEKHYTYIGHFRNGEEKFSYIVICLTIDGVPSFVFLNIPTRDEDVLNHYRRGEEIRTDRGRTSQRDLTQAEILNQKTFEELYFQLRQKEDIPPEAFEKFQGFVEPTLEDPEEIWTFTNSNKQWFVFMARQTVRVLLESDDIELQDFIMISIGYVPLGSHQEIELVFSFPTLDPALVQHFRKGVNGFNKAYGVGWSRRVA